MIGWLNRLVEWLWPRRADAARAPVIVVQPPASSQPTNVTPPVPEERGFFGRTRFAGALSGHGSTIPIGFDAWIDGLGTLHLELDRIPFSREAYALQVDQRPGTAVDLIAIEGTSAAGHRLRSDSFHIAHFSHGSQPGAELSYQGDCHDAELELPPNPDRDTSRDTRAWRVRQFRTFRRIARDTPLGRVIVGGPRQNRESQDPDGFIALHRPAGDATDGWWEESERFLTHLARVLSFACDTYLRPVIEERYDGGRVTVRVARQGRASGPYMAPFHELHMEPILACACDSYFTRHGQVEQLDAAIRWLTAPVAYDESRLINAMSALENILDRCGLEQVDLFMRASPFRRVARRVREALVAADAPDGMADKIPQLNRRSLADKVMALLDAREIVVDDMPDNWLAIIIRQRNTIVHTGVSQELGELEPDTLNHTIWAREIVTRIILERLGFVGAYRSWFHHDEQLHFPECLPMEQWVRQQEASASEPPPA